MGFLTQDPTYIGGSQSGQDQILGGYDAQKAAYEQQRREGARLTSVAGNAIGSVPLGMGTNDYNRYVQEQQRQYTNAPNDLVQMAQVQGPSVAEAAGRATLQQVQNGNLAIGGAANNSALGTRNAIMANARAGSNVAGQVAAARAAEEQAYQQRVLAAAQARNAAYQQGVVFAGQNVLGQSQVYNQGYLGQGQLGLGQQGLYVNGFQGQQQLGQNVQMTQAQMDAQREAANTQAVTSLVGGAVGGAAQTAASLYTGGASNAVLGAR